MTKVHCNLPKYLWGEVNIYCFWVRKGKPAAVLEVDNKYVRGVKKYIKDVWQQHTYLESPTTKQWTSVWIYKKDYVLEIIKNAPREPKTIFDYWILGKLFGYSDESINECLNNIKVNQGLKFSPVTSRAGR